MTLWNRYAEYHRGPVPARCAHHYESSAKFIGQPGRKHQDRQPGIQDLGWGGGVKEYGLGCGLWVMGYGLWVVGGGKRRGGSGIRMRPTGFLEVMSRDYTQGRQTITHKRIDDER